MAKENWIRERSKWNSNVKRENFKFLMHYREKSQVMLARTITKHRHNLRFPAIYNFFIPFTQAFVSIAVEPPTFSFFHDIRFLDT